MLQPCQVFAMGQTGRCGHLHRRNDDGGYGWNRWIGRHLLNDDGHGGDDGNHGGWGGDDHR